MDSKRQPEEYVMYRGQWSVIRPIRPPEDFQTSKRSQFNKGGMDSIQEMESAFYSKRLPGVDNTYSYV